MDNQYGNFETRMANYTYQPTIQPIQPLQVKEYGIVLCGRTGCGKSATGNTIIGRDVFESNLSPKSVTGVSSYAKSKYGEHTITVVDTPGIHDNVRTDSFVKMEIARMAFLLREGVHCFVICMDSSAVRVTKETQTFLKAVEVSGHVDFFDYCMLVYTKPESGLCGVTLNKYVETQKEHAEMKSFLEKFGDRMLAVNNRATDPREKKRNKDAIIAIVDRMIESHKSKPKAFTNDTMETAKKLSQQVDSVVERGSCHPSLVNTVIEAVIWFSKWGTVAEEEFVKKVIEILCKSEQCNNDGTNLVFRNDDEVTTISVADCKEHIKKIYEEIRSNIGRFYKLLGTILNYKKTYLGSTGALATGAGIAAGATGIGAAVGAILGVPAVIAYMIGDKMR